MINRFKCSLFNAMKKVQYFYRVLVLTLIGTLAFTSTAYASQPSIVSGTIKLLQDASTWLVILIPLGSGLFVAFHGLQKSMTNDQAVIAEKNKLIKNTIIGAVIAECGMGLIAFILSYYN